MQLMMNTTVFVTGTVATNDNLPYKLSLEIDLLGRLQTVIAILTGLKVVCAVVIAILYIPQTGLGFNLKFVRSHDVPCL